MNLGLRNGPGSCQQNVRPRFLVKRLSSQIGEFIPKRIKALKNAQRRWGWIQNIVQGPEPGRDLPNNRGRRGVVSCWIEPGQIGDKSLIGIALRDESKPSMRLI